MDMASVVAQPYFDLALDLALDPARAEDPRVHAWQDALRRTGACVLPGFTTGPALAGMLAEARQLEGVAYHSVVTGNDYLSEIDPALPGDLRRRSETTALAVVAYDQIPPDGLLRRLYQWPPLRELVRAILGLPALYPYECPMGALNLTVMRAGDSLRWHFDQSDFVVSMPLQEPERGGAFEFVHQIRNQDDERYDAVGRLLDGARDGVQLLDFRPGELVLFKGKHTIHRVTEIHGARPRLGLLLSYAERPGVTSTLYLRRIRYGREH